ncbi:hypothetical protein EDI_131920 [Entamoeba dispar SAW760]|uniref:Uncharacterized protein n=1 Tax=Entamoeba dispar (strain ATCC PRA-260 / SAW760) TaxID=370354 RepID=B0E773_ENTDS|nr:uncharacterized protein EDI_131920 [Entamoeba dispar SAW760]EDR29623.1 hypothetical protein EDI_131920 [Entamoeba dispar SAW760]|eukprot:EDR29623.1 hypothetical protein EDI_131920 [Entamoeba dispar SAW760]
MSTNTSSHSTRQTLQSFTRSTHRTNTSITMNISSKQTYASILTNTQMKPTTKNTSGKVNFTTNDDIEDINEFPFNKKVFLFTIIFPCIGYYGIFHLNNSNRRERLWGVAMLIYAVLMMVVVIVIIALFVSLY